MMCLGKMKVLEPSEHDGRLQVPVDSLPLGSLSGLISSQSREDCSLTMKFANQVNFSVPEHNTTLGH